MTPSFGPDRPRRDPLPPSPPVEDFKLLRTLAVGSMVELAAIRREEGPRLQFEGFFPVVVPPPPGMRGEIRELAGKLQLGVLTDDELVVLSTSVAAATFPKDERGQELCRKLIKGINLLNWRRSEDASATLDSKLCRELPLTRLENREYGKRFAEMEFPSEFFTDELGRAMWRGFISGSLPLNEQALFNRLVHDSGRELVVGTSGLITLQEIGDREPLF